MTVDRLLPRVFAHRCGGALAPENTLAGLSIAAGLGVRAVEFDVMLSADRTPWLIHDPTLERTTDGSGPVCAASDRLLVRLDAGVRHHPAFAGEPLPTLESAARLCRRLGLLANVEIKPAAGLEELTGRVVAQQVRDLWAGAASRPLLSSFSGEALAAARAAAPELAVGCLYQQVPDDWLVRCRNLGAFSLHCDAGFVADEVIDEARCAGIAVLCYTVNHRECASSLFRRGVAAVFSDRIDRVTG